MTAAVAILTAAGSGSRLGSPGPKALAELAGEPLVTHAARALSASGVVERIVVTAPEGAESAIEDALAAADLGVRVEVVTGGASRQASVAAGLARLADVSGDRVVLVHDAARPLVPSAVVRRVAAAVTGGRTAVVPGLPVPDTLKQTAGDAVVTTVDRERLRAVQTPQGFTLDVLRSAHAAGAYLAAAEDTAATDDAALVEALGVPVWVVAGDPDAMKITTARDLSVAGALVGSPLPRTGIGVDVHAFAAPGADTELWVAGLHWPGQPGLVGHSDGDVVAHALADALLSAAGLGDLGSAIGTDDPQWANAAGVAILREVARRVRAAGYEVGNAAVQLIGERPRLASRRAEAEAVLGVACGAPVSVSGTTSDGLGLTGRAEGAAAIATALVVARTGRPGY